MKIKNMSMNKKNYFFSLFNDARVRNKNTDLIFLKILFKNTDLIFLKILFSYIKIKNMCIRKNKFIFIFLFTDVRVGNKKILI